MTGAFTSQASRFGPKKPILSKLESIVAISGILDGYPVFVRRASLSSMIFATTQAMGLNVSTLTCQSKWEWEWEWAAAAGIWRDQLRVSAFSVSHAVISGSSPTG